VVEHMEDRHWKKNYQGCREEEKNAPLGAVEGALILDGRLLLTGRGRNGGEKRSGGKSFACRVPSIGEVFQLGLRNGREKPPRRVKSVPGEVKKK